MIHLTHARLTEAIIAMIQEISSESFGSQTEPDLKLIQKVAATAGISLFLTRLGIKESKESIANVLDKLKEEQPHSIFNEEHRKIVGTMIQEMFSPAGARRFVVVGVTEEFKVIISPVHSESQAPMEPQEVVRVFQHFIDCEKDGDRDVLEL